MIFTDVGESFIIEIRSHDNNNPGYKTKGFYEQKKLYGLEDRIVLYIEEDDKCEGFFFVSSQKYDNQVTLLHSGDESKRFEMSFDKIVQPHMVKIFDLNFYYNERKVPTENVISLIGMIDDEFVVDQGKYYYPILRENVSVQ